MLKSEVTLRQASESGVCVIVPAKDDKKVIIELPPMMASYWAQSLLKEADERDPLRHIADLRTVRIGPSLRSLSRIILLPACHSRPSCQRRAHLFASTAALGGRCTAGDVSRATGWLQSATHAAPLAAGCAH